MSGKILTIYIHNKLVVDEDGLEEKRKLWEGKLGIAVSKSEYCNLFKKIYLVTNHSKLRSFQYRTLLHAVITNRNVYHSGLIETDLCTFCKSMPETTRHLLFNCEGTKVFLVKQ